MPVALHQLTVGNHWRISLYEPYQPGGTPCDFAYYDIQSCTIKCHKSIQKDTPACFRDWKGRRCVTVFIVLCYHYFIEI